MAILTASEDKLRYDALRGNGMDLADPLGPLASKRIKTYDKDLGFAMQPEQKEGALQFKEQVNETAGKQQSALDTYKNEFKTSMAAADQQAQGILGGIQNAPNQQKVAVNIIADDGSIEATYHVNRDWADQNLPGSGLNVTPVDGGFNIGVRVDGRVQGQEIHQMIGQAQEQTGLIDQEIAGANSGINDSRKATELEIASQRGIATGRYDLNVSQSEQVIEQTKAQWTTFVADQQQAFQAGVETNTGGIRDLINSGALVIKGTVA